MSGRHSVGRPERRRRERLSPGLAVGLAGGMAAVVVAAVVLVVVLWRSNSSPNAAPSGRCTSGVRIDALADPSVAATIDDLAARWTTLHPAVDGICPLVNVRGELSSSVVTELSASDAAPPQLWIPDSALWVDRLRAKTKDESTPVNSIWLYPSIASSPLVVVSGRGPAVQRSGEATGWAGVLCGSQPVSLADPSHDTAGLAAVLTAQMLLDGAASTPSRSLIGCLRSLQNATVSDSEAALRALAATGSSSSPLITSEQAALHASSPSRLVITRPPGRAVGLDWPVVQFSPPGGDPAVRTAASAFAAWLSSGTARARLAADGLRTPDGRLSAGGPAVATLPRPAVARQTEAVRSWTTAGRISRTLIVIDLSGSMNSSIAAGKTKIQLASEAVGDAIDFFPDSSSLGLWGFSTNRTASTDWSDLVPLGPLSDMVGSRTRRSALTVAARALPSQVRGGTGLYRTTLAAYDAVRSGYDPKSLNSVVLLTDGYNSERRGPSLADLLRNLRGAADPARPLPIITVAFGLRTDTATLRQISAATRGRTYVAARPGDLRDALLDALINAA